MFKKKRGFTVRSAPLVVVKRSTCSVCGCLLRGAAKLGQKGEIYCAGCHKFYCN